MSQSTVPIPTSWATTVAPDRFRHRCQLEHGVGIDGGALTQLANPESLCVHSLTSVHHGHRHAGNTGTCHEVVREAVELPDRVVDLPVRDRHPPGVETRAGVADDRPGREVVSESDEHPASRATVSTTGTAAADSRELFLLVMDTRFSLAGLSSVHSVNPVSGNGGLILGQIGKPCSYFGVLVVRLPRMEPSVTGFQGSNNATSRAVINAAPTVKYDAMAKPSRHAVFIV